MNQPNTPFNRQRKSAFRFLLMLLLTTLASTLSAQTLHGIVTDGSNHRLKGVSVSLLDSSQTDYLLCDEHGGWALFAGSA